MTREGVRHDGNISRHVPPGREGHHGCLVSGGKGQLSGADRHSRHLAGEGRGNPPGNLSLAQEELWRQPCQLRQGPEEWVGNVLLC